MILALAYDPIEFLESQVSKLNDYFKFSINSREIYIIWEEFVKNYCCDNYDKIFETKNIFSPNFWSLVKRVNENIPTNTKCLEGWCRYLNKNIINLTAVCLNLEQN
ncbi:hypothetical protein DMUE_3152 [Dictyocoela muelleri]|nr:hypothetical protein DMUE_3152 [Dictyocoela muelleri]